MAHILTKGVPGDNADFLVDDTTIATDAALNAELGNVEPGTVAHTAGYAVQKEKGLDGSWVEISI